ncbi:MAG: bifunctional metallophosphatase/5'-nucleotidase, partial [Candidatus Cloacimonetes bacterium]|nr:bifunctional metallophosphatase/5'-nucleotidase [Candidatus Cloacimonadota bacterium]MCK9243180.1 bifunctional metallophosphatase/5'-nucleotidase [Candidatus Cloacimonadota bacterium]
NKSIALEKPYDIMSLSSPSWLSEQSSAFMIGDQQLDPDKLYRVVTHDYIISQWDKYLDFESQAIDETGDLFLDAIIRQVQQQLNE